jgi:hypothetical protein
MVLRQDPPVDPKKGKPNAVTAVQETVSSPMGVRPRPAAPIGTFGVIRQKFRSFCFRYKKRG